MSTEINSLDLSTHRKPPASPDPALVSVVIEAAARPARSRRWRLAGILTVAGLILLVGVSMLPKIRWRVRTVGLELTGHIPDITLSDLLVMMMPGSGQD